jgi:hypothetical protein
MPLEAGAGAMVKGILRLRMIGLWPIIASLRMTD